MANGTLTVTINDTDGATAAYGALVRLYGATMFTYAGAEFPVLGGDSFTAQGVTNSSGQVVFSVPPGDYLIHVEPHRTGMPPQFVNALRGSTDEDPTMGWTVTVPSGGTASATAQLRGALADPDAIVVGYSFWKDTTANQVLRLYPGEERRALVPPGVWSYDPLARHVLIGPFDQYSKAAAA